MPNDTLDRQQYDQQKKEWVIARITAIKTLYSFEQCDNKIKDPERDLWYDIKTKNIYLDNNGFPGKLLK